MINKSITAALKNPFLTIMSFLAVIILGIIAVLNTPVDALPDLSENQVIVMTQWNGQNPRNIEDQITFPLTVGLQGLAGVKDIRAMSQMGVSMVTVIFEDDVDIYFARDRVSERLSLITEQLPSGVTPILGPDATGLGQIFMYTLESDQHSLTELRTMQDFTVRYALQSVPGVAEVASVGGYVQTYQVVVDPTKLLQYNLGLPQVMSSIASANNNVAGKVLTHGDKEIAIQGLGFFETPDAIAHVVLGMKEDRTPLTVADIATTRVSGKFRRSILADAEQEQVGGIVIMRYGQNPLAVITEVKKTIHTLEQSLPEGIRIVPFYDRTELIHASVNTLTEVLTQELVITGIILGIFLWHGGATLITIITLLIGVLITFICMYLLGIPSNIMSLGGISVAIGTMVDSAIVVSENAYNALIGKTHLPLRERIRIVLSSTLEIGKPIVFAIFIIILSFIPIFSLTGMEGKLFTPLAYTNTFAMFGALIAALLLVPILSAFFLRGKLQKDEHIPIVRILQKGYEPLLRFVLRFRKITLMFMCILLALGGFLFTRIGSEFMPPLDEGSIMYMPMTLPNVSEERAQELLLMTNAIIGDFPEVATVVGKAGRANTATDPAPLAMIETFITLKPKSEWRKGMTKSRLIGQMNRALRIENLWNGFTQPIIGRVDMLSTGIRSQVGLKIYGDDPLELEKIAIQAEDILENIPGASGVAAIRTTGLEYLDISLNDALIAKHGLNKSHLLTLISAGIGGMTMGKTIQGRENIDIEVRLKESNRDSIADIKSLIITTPHGAQVTLGQVADIQLTDGPAVITSENGMIRSAVQLNVRGRDLVSFVEEAKLIINRDLSLPEGYTTEWSGQYQNQLRASAQLSWIVPLVLFIIFILLFVTYKDLGLVSIVLITIPLSIVGGVVALFAAQYNFSVAVWVGFISLFGNAVETGMVIIVYLENAFREKFGLPLEGESREAQPTTPITKAGIHEAVLEGAMKRLRPILMTAFTSVIGLIPMISATGVGAEVQKPLALVVVGGMTTSVILTLFILPILFSYLRERQITSTIL